MRRIVLLLASVVLVVLLASGVVMAQEADTTPETTIDQWDRPYPYEDRTKATFGFSSNDAEATFECKLDNGSFAACASPKSYYSLMEGQHTFAVRAKDAAGNVDPTPAEYTWEKLRAFLLKNLISGCTEPSRMALCL